MENEKIELRSIGKDFGEGKYLSWKDGETKKVLIADWGVYDKLNDEGKLQLSFRANVLNCDGVEHLVGNKIIDTTSINFHKSIRPLIEGVNEPIHLEITRIGEKKKTTFQIKKV